MKCDACGSFKNPAWKSCLVCGEPLVIGELWDSNLAPKWRKYLLERVEILIKFESYTPEKAREEVLAMAKLPYYQ